MTVSLMEIRNFKDLEKAISQKIKKAMENEVAKKAIGIGQDMVEQEVYQKYTPTMYERTGELKESFETKPIKDGIELTNTRSDGDRYIPEIIEHGHWGSDQGGYEYPSYNEDGSPRAYMNPRPFMQKTKEQLENGEFKDALVKGLKSEGLKVE